MNRRHLAVIALVIAVGLFGAPLVSPVPDYGPHIDVGAHPVNFTTEQEKSSQLRNATTVDYQNLSDSTQHLFDRANKSDRRDDVTVRFEEAPDSLTTLFSNGSESELNQIYVHKDEQYYHMDLYRFTPGPSLQTLMLRLGPLLGAIGLGTLAGYFVLTTED